MDVTHRDATSGDQQIPAGARVRPDLQHGGGSAGEARDPELRLHLTFIPFALSFGRGLLL